MRTSTMLRICGMVAVGLVVFGAIETPAFGAGTPAGTVISNFATGNYKDVNGNALPQVTSNTVTTTVLQVGGADVTPATGAQGSGPGETVYYPVDVTNTGNGSDALSLNLNTTGLPAGWTAFVYHDANGDGILQQSEIDAGAVTTTGTIAADSTFKAIIAVTSDPIASSGASGSVTLTATSTFDTNVTDSGTYTTTIAAAVIYLTKSYAPSSPEPGDIVTYTINGGNSGLDTAYVVVITDTIPQNTTYVPNSVVITTPSGGTSYPQTDAPDLDMTTVSGGVVTINWGKAYPGVTGTITFQVQVNTGVAAGVSVGNTTVVNYESPAGNAQPPATSNTSTFSVAVSAGVLVTPDSTHYDVAPGDTIQHAFTVTNTGNGTDTYTLTGTGGFLTWKIYRDVNGNGVVDAGEPQITSTAALSSGASTDLVAFAIIPAGTGDLTQDLHTVTATSTLDGAVSDQTKIASTVHVPVLTLSKTISPTGNQPPGTVLTYTVTYTNTGTGDATSVVFVDAIPANTTYVSDTGGAGKGSLKVNGVFQTNAADADFGKIDGGSVIVNLPTVGAGGSGTFSFQVTIN